MLAEKISSYYKRQEELSQRQKEKEVELKRNSSEKRIEQELREKKLTETKLKYDAITEENKRKLVEKLEKVDERVSNHI